MEQIPSLSGPEKQQILRLAREALMAAVRKEAHRPTDKDYSGRLGLPGACFVTLHKRGDLRGCIGLMSAEQSLASAIIAMAEAAALRDARFAPVQPEELDQISLEVSVLSPCIKIKGPSDVRVGEHGLLISKGIHRGVLLPQVAAEHGWNAETFLRQTCVKAGLPPDSWSDPGAVLEVFSAEILSEES